MSYTPKHLLDNKNKYPNKPSISEKIDDIWLTMTWLQYYDYVIKIAKSLIAMNLQVGDKASIYSYNRKEWFGCYSAMQMLNSVSVAVYHTSSSAEVEWIVGTRILKLYLSVTIQIIMVKRIKCPLHVYFQLWIILSHLRQLS